MAIDLQSDRVRVAHIVRNGPARPRVTALRAVERTRSESEDLAQLRKSVGLQGHRCTTALDAGAYHVVQLPAPAVPAHEVKEALRWAVKDALDFPVDEAVLDCLQIPSDGTRTGRPALVLAVAARRERVRSRVQAFQRAGVALQAIDVAEAGQRNLAALFEQHDRGLAFIAFDDRRGLLTFSRNGELYALRHIDVGVKALSDSAPPEARQQLFERIALELQRSLDNFDRQFSQVALQCLLVAPYEGRDALVAYLRQNLAPPVESAALESVFDHDDGAVFGSEAEQAAWLPALGLALRQETTTA